MRTRFLVTLLAATAISSAAFAQGTTLGGAAGGAAVGGVVGGPVGAVVGAGVGATVGMAAEPPAPVVTYVERERVPSVAVQEKIVIGEPLPATVQLHTIPQYETYRFAVVNNQRVIVDPGTRKVVKIVK